MYSADLTMSTSSIATISSSIDGGGGSIDGGRGNKDRQVVSAAAASSASLSITWSPSLFWSSPFNWLLFIKFSKNNSSSRKKQNSAPRCHHRLSRVLALVLPHQQYSRQNSFHYYSSFFMVIFMLLAVILGANGSGLDSSITPGKLSVEDNARVRLAIESDANGFEAIRLLHGQMDDDLSGTVDLEESSEFVREELNVQDTMDVSERQHNFHPNNDGYITVPELWRRWVLASERNWTVDDTVNWLIDAVELPQYKDNFIRNAVDGRTLPRLAIQNTSFMIHVLGITNAVHRQKIHLKAMDAVLFGYANSNGHLKDCILFVLLLFFIGLYGVSRYQKTLALEQYQKISRQMKNLKNIEEQFVELQTRLETGDEIQGQLRKEIAKSHDEKQRALGNLQRELAEAERQLSKGVQLSPLALQPLLRVTCRNEIAHINAQKKESQLELKEAIQLVEKLRKKGTSAITSFKLAFSSNNEAENMEQLVAKIKAKMDHTAAMTDECMKRWREIESLCGFDLMSISSSDPPVSSSHHPHLHQYHHSLRGGHHKLSANLVHPHAVASAALISTDGPVSFHLNESYDTRSLSQANIGATSHESSFDVMKRQQQSTPKHDYHRNNKDNGDNNTSTDKNRKHAGAGDTNNCSSSGEKKKKTEKVSSTTTYSSSNNNSTDNSSTGKSSSSSKSTTNRSFITHNNNNRHFSPSSDNDLTDMTASTSTATTTSRPSSNNNILSFRKKTKHHHHH